MTTGGPGRWWTHARVHTGERVLEDHGVLTRDGRVITVAPSHAVPEGVDEAIDLDGAHLAPGLVDLQVNGGGGASFTEAPDATSLERIADAHRSMGTTAFLATCISAPAATIQRAIDVVATHPVPGCAGLHLEGPALDGARAGAHPAEDLRGLGASELSQLARLAPRALRVTCSARHATDELLGALKDLGAVVSLGHTQATAAEARAAFDRGVGGVTHLFNAMGGLKAREPGAAGAALVDDRVHCGIIADGVHVAPESIAVARRSKPPGTLHLVSDAIALAGSELDETVLGGQRVRRDGLRCVNDDGTLAGSAASLLDGVRFCVREVGIPLDEALRMASTDPARHQRLSGHGVIAPGARASCIVLDDALELRRVLTPELPGGTGA